MLKTRITAIGIAAAALFVGSIETPAYALSDGGERKAARLVSQGCTPAQRNFDFTLNLIPNWVNQIDRTSNGHASDAAINALLDLMDEGQKALPVGCK